MLGPIAGGEAMKGNLSVTGGNIVCPLHRWTSTTARAQF